MSEQVANTVMIPVEEYQQLLTTCESQAKRIDGLVDMLEQHQWAVPTSHETGKDTFECPECGEAYMPGVGGKHGANCELNQLLSKTGETHD